MTLNLLVRNGGRYFNLARNVSVLCNTNKYLSNNGIILRNVHDTKPSLKKSEVTVTFVRACGERLTVKGKVGDTILDTVVDSGVDLEGFGACEGTLTCSTCHVILKKEDYDRLPEKPVDEEMDMLDLAHGLTDTSRLGCQITLTEDLDGLELQVPAGINDARK